MKDFWSWVSNVCLAIAIVMIAYRVDTLAKIIEKRSAYRVSFLVKDKNLGEVCLLNELGQSAHAEFNLSDMLNGRAFELYLSNIKFEEVCK